MMHFKLNGYPALHAKPRVSVTFTLAHPSRLPATHPLHNDRHCADSRMRRRRFSLPPLLPSPFQLTPQTGTGKSSLITCLVKDHFRPTKIQPTLPALTINAPEGVSTTIVDTSSLPQERNGLRKEIRRSNVICLVYSDHYSYERVSLFWLPFFRSLGVNLPVILCANKSDLYPDVEAEKEMMPIMLEFKEIDSCIRASAKELRNINEVYER